MANTRIKDISTAASTLNSDDFIAVDGNTAGTRKIAKADLITEVSTGVSGTYLEESNNLSDVASKDTSKLNLEVPDVGTGPQEVPLNSMLSGMAYMSPDSVSVAELLVESTTGTGSTQALTVTDGSSTNFVVQEDGRVGVNQTSPGSYSTAADDLVVGDLVGARGITLASGTGNSGNIYFADGTSGAEQYRGYVSYNHSTDTLRLGTSGTERWSIDSSGNLVANGTAIDFGSTTTGTGTVTANGGLLDDYEEGLFTPVVADAASGGNTATPGTAEGRYTKVGRIVQFSCLVSNIDTTGLTAGLGLYIQGLPFPGVAVSSWKPMTVLMDTITFSGQVVGIIGQNESAIRFKQFASGGADSDVLVSSVSSGTSDIHIQGVYEVV